jgi:hypothetical protein
MLGAQRGEAREELAEPGVLEQRPRIGVDALVSALPFPAQSISVLHEKGGQVPDRDLERLYAVDAENGPHPLIADSDELHRAVGILARQVARLADAQLHHPPRLAANSKPTRRDHSPKWNGPREVAHSRQARPFPRARQARATHYNRDRAGYAVARRMRWSGTRIEEAAAPLGAVACKLVRISKVP